MTQPAPENSPVDSYRTWRGRGQHSPPIWMQGVVALFAIGALTWVMLNLWPATVQQQARTEDPTQGAIVQARHHQLPVQIVRQRARMLTLMEPSQETRRYELYAYVDALVKARNLIRQTGPVVQNEDLLEAVADAIHAGGRPADIRRVLQQGNDTERLAALSFYWSYLQDGLASEPAAKRALHRTRM